MKDKYKIKNIPEEIQDIVVNILETLDSEYGENRSKNDLGGYVVIIEDKNNFNKFNKISLNFNTVIAEYVDEIKCSNGEIYLNALILLSSDYSISVIVNMKDAPINIISLSDDNISYIEQLMSKITNDEIKERLYENFDKTLSLAKAVVYKEFDNDIISMFLFIKDNIRKDVSIDNTIKYYNELIENGFVKIANEHLIYTESCNLIEFAREELEIMLDDEICIYRLLDKESIINMWLEGTSKNEVIEDLVRNIDIEELLDLNSYIAFDSSSDNEYKYAEIYW